MDNWLESKSFGNFFGSKNMWYTKKLSNIPLNSVVGRREYFANQKFADRTN